MPILRPLSLVQRRAIGRLGVGGAVLPSGQGHVTADGSGAPARGGLSCPQMPWLRAGYVNMALVFYVNQ